jgi:hypothetical protein
MAAADGLPRRTWTSAVDLLSCWLFGQQWLLMSEELSPTTRAADVCAMAAEELARRTKASIRKCC